MTGSPRTLFATVAALLLLGGFGVFVHETKATLTEIPTGPAVADVQAAPARTLAPRRPFLVAAELDDPGWWMSWALVDTVTGREVGSANWREPNDPQSMIKAWIAADYLNTYYPEAMDPPAWTLDQLSTMIRDSDNEVARAYWDRMGGRQTTARLVDTCGIEDVVSRPWAWSLTELSARDAALLGVCIKDGRAAGRWTDWLLGEMRQVRGEGDFGIRAAFPELHDAIAIKNGWEFWEGRWEVNCLAIGEDWVLAVEQRAPSFDAASQECETVAETLRTSALAG